MTIDEIIANLDCQAKDRPKKEERGHGGYVFTLKIENHNNEGYHGHVEIKVKERYIRTNQMVTSQGGAYYIERHGRGLPIEAIACIEPILEQVKDQMVKRLGRFQDTNLRKPVYDAIMIHPNNGFIDGTRYHGREIEGECKAKEGLKNEP